jgi:hypothetical protein
MGILKFKQSLDKLSDSLRRTLLNNDLPTITMTSQPGQLAREMRSKLFRHMLETRGWKYRVFLRYLRFFKYAAFAPVRGEFLESYYTLMRYLDDVVDGDLPLSEDYLDEAAYLSAKIAFSMQRNNPVDEVDYLMLHCFELAERFGEEFQSETKDILESLMFDALRRGKGIIFTEKELSHHFHLLDIRGTIRATLKIFKDDPGKYRMLEPLGTACRYQYDIEDFDSDIKAGYVNISAEEHERFGIKPQDLYQKSSPGIRLWLHHHAKDGMALLSEHHRIMPQGKFSLFERLVFRLVYENPARKVFKGILAVT